MIERKINKLPKSLCLAGGLHLADTGERNNNRRPGTCPGCAFRNI
jgi:hypothetical protein